MEGMLRTMKNSMTGRLGKELDSNHVVLQWLVRWIGGCWSRYAVGEDGRTGWERLYRRRCTAVIAEFGESVHYREENNPDHKRRNQDDAGWREGVWLGLTSKSNESYIGTPQGVIRTAEFKRRPDSEKWNFDVVNAVRGSVQCPDPAVPGQDAVPICVHVEVPEVPGEPRMLER